MLYYNIAFRVTKKRAQLLIMKIMIHKLLAANNIFMTKEITQKT